MPTNRVSATDEASLELRQVSVRFATAAGSYTAVER